MSISTTHYNEQVFYPLYRGYQCLTTHASNSSRNKALKDSDWSVLNDVPLNPATKSAWMNYRTLLRNLTDNLSTVEDVKALTLPIPPK